MRGARPQGLTPQQLYAVLRAIETRFGRERRERWAARTLDLDIVAMDGLSGTFGAITLPHPRMHERAFVLGAAGRDRAGLAPPGPRRHAGDVLLAARSEIPISRLAVSEPETAPCG